jgi:hypothetical protein
MASRCPKSQAPQVHRCAFQANQQSARVFFVFPIYIYIDVYIILKNQLYKFGDIKLRVKNEKRNNE